MYLYQCTCTNVTVPMYLYQCTCTNVPIPMYLYQCTYTNIHISLYLFHCTNNFVEKLPDCAQGLWAHLATYSANPDSLGALHFGLMTIGPLFSVSEIGVLPHIYLPTITRITKPEKMAKTKNYLFLLFSFSQFSKTRKTWILGSEVCRFVKCTPAWSDSHVTSLQMESHCFAHHNQLGSFVHTIQ